MRARSIQLRSAGVTHVATATLIGIQLLAVAPLPAHAQQLPKTTISVVIDSSFRARAERFLEELRGRLAPEAREAIEFRSVVMSTSEIPAALSAQRWEIAILSTLTLANARTKTPVTAFEMPFVFPQMMRSVLAVQQSHAGRAALSSFPEHGLTGLVYLNAGVTLVGSQSAINSPSDLKGRKIAVSSAAQVQTFEKIGTAAVALPGGEVSAALGRGLVNSVVVNSGNPDGVTLSNPRFLLTDSIKAQVAVVVTQDATWDRVPFVHRAMIGDAAIAASQRLDQTLLEIEDSLLARARSSGVGLVSFQADDASGATLQWIGTQPEALRDIYSTMFTHITKTNRPNPPPPGQRGGQLGRVHFATTRDDTGNGSVLYRFGDARTDVVKCGQIEFVPAAADSKFVGQVTADNLACGTQLNAILQSSKRMLIYVHGFNNRFSDAAERAIFLKTALGADTEVVFWSWPSKRDGLAGNYKYDKESVGGIARQSFVRLLRALKSGADVKPLSVLAHSMGGWHTVGALQVLSDEPSRTLLNNVVLAAPDVPTDEFVFALGGLSRMAKRSTLYACAWDWALLVSQDMNAYPRAGTGGADIVVSDKLESIDVDAAWSANHSYVFEPGKVLKDLSTLVLSEADANSRGLSKKPKAPWHYWHFP